ncbi:MAG: hypothetical protein HY764_02160 [Candidatus Portnoybacteria bacterium]|nr:hypothetical protein [Candidatus Portnoybacteria bacterium]
MHLGQCLVMSQSLELRQRLEIELTQSLSLMQQQKLELKLYVTRENELTRLYRKALGRRMVRLYDKHGMKFEYALVRVKDVPADLRADGNWAFSHCLFNGFEALLFGSRYAMARGSWLLFVIYDMYLDAPKHYIEYAAVHERGEQVTLGDHNLASKLEFAIAKKKNDLVKYMAWIEKNCPAKLADIFSYQTHLALPASDEFQELLELLSSSEETTMVRQMIEEFEWPFRLLQKLAFYKKRNEEVIEIITQALRDAEILASQRGAPLKELVGLIRNVIAMQLRFIAERKLESYINFPHINALWRELRIQVDREFSKMLSARKEINPNYFQEIIEANIVDSLHRNGVLSFSFPEALRSI